MGDTGVLFALVVILLAVVLTIAWIILPFIVFDIKKILMRIEQNTKKTEQDVRVLNQKSDEQ